MNFGFDDDQDLLREQVRRFLDERCPIEQVRRIQQEPSGYDEKLWKELAELGWLGMTIDEQYGGAGLSWLEMIVLLEETGRGLFPSPLISTTLAATALSLYGDAAQKERWLPGIANGSQIGTLAFLEESDSIDPYQTGLRGEPDGDGFILDGEKHFVADPESASLLIVSFRSCDKPADVALAVIDANQQGVTGKSYPAIDATKRLGNVKLEGVRVGPENLLGAPGSASEKIANLIDIGAVAVTAEISGAVEEAIRITVEYANSRVQFDHPIGHFQGVKHPIAEMHHDLESFRSLLYYAGWLIDNQPDELPRMASLAKAYATDSFVRTGLDSVILHGAIGFTVDYDIQLYFKRSKWARPMFGDADTHYERAFALRGD